MRAETGVTSQFSAAHTNAAGVLHGHDWKVTAWFKEGFDADELVIDLRYALEGLDHSTLPQELASGEAIGKEVMRRLGERCTGIDVSRPLLGIHARVRR